MMKIQDIRIGNFVAYQNELKWVVEVRQQEIGIWDRGKKKLLLIPFDKIAPIEIAEGWLERLGFSKIQDCWSIGNSLTLSRNRDSWEVMVGLFLGDVTQFVPNAQNLVYLHQMQNVYFATTLQELKIQ